MAFVNLESPAQNEIVNTLYPSFCFNYSVVGATNLGVEVASDPAMGITVIQSQLVLNPLEWQNCETTPNTHINFVFPAIKILPNGTYYWRAWIFDPALPGYRLSETRQIIVAGAAYPWKLNSNEIIPIKNGVKIDTEIVGCSRQIKRTISFTFAPMEEAQKNILEAIFDIDTTISFVDNNNENIIVYWGNCERNIAGDAFPPKDKEFGITIKNIIAGALRWEGTAVFSEV